MSQKNSRKGCASGLLAVAILSLGCNGDSDTSPIPASGDAGVDGPDPMAADLCPDACAALLKAGAPMDVPACEAQCAKEVTGEGYLVDHIAIKLFQEIRDAEPGTEYLYIQSMQPWVDWLRYEKQPDEYSLPVDEADADVLEECVQVMFSCEEDDRPRWESHCFSVYYRYNHDFREEIASCFDSTYACKDKHLCVNQKQISLGLTKAPWLDGVPPPPF